MHNGQSDFIDWGNRDTFLPNDYKAIVRQNTNEPIAIVKNSYKVVPNDILINKMMHELLTIDTPFKQVSPLRTPESDLQRFFELEEIAKVRDIFKEHPLKNLVEFFLLTGTRRKEVLIISWNDVGFRRKIIKIPSIYTKGKKHRLISFIFDEKLETLMNGLTKRSHNMLFGKEDDAKRVGKRISKTLTKNGFPWATCHTFRHIYISHLSMGGVPLPTIKEMVGHASIETTLKYAHLAQSHLDNMIKKRPY